MNVITFVNVSFLDLVAQFRDDLSCNNINKIYIELVLCKLDGIPRGRNFRPSSENKKKYDDTKISSRVFDNENIEQVLKRRSTNRERHGKLGGSS